MPLVIAIMALFFGYCLGYVGAHKEVATECQRLGGFYVGTDNYECSKRGEQ